jgi:Domain of unknown function (DUF1992)
MHFAHTPPGAAWPRRRIKENFMRNLPTLDEQIALSIRASEQSGELQSARDWGKPLNFGDGFDETPQELRMAFKILKDAGFVPPEVELMKEVNAMRDRLAELDPAGSDAARLREHISELQLKITVRIEKLLQNGL